MGRRILGHPTIFADVMRATVIPRPYRTASKCLTPDGALRTVPGVETAFTAANVTHTASNRLTDLALLGRGVSVRALALDILLVLVGLVVVPAGLRRGRT